MPTNKSQSGFTLIELIMVIILLGVLAVSVAPKIDNNAIDVRRAAQDLVEAIRYTQQLSMNHSGDSLYRITITANSYTVDQADGTGVANPQTGTVPYTANSKEWSGIANDSTGVISFNSRGEPTCTTFADCSNPDPNFGTTISITLRKNGASDTTVKMIHFTGYTYVE